MVKRSEHRSHIENTKFVLLTAFLLLLVISLTPADSYLRRTFNEEIQTFAQHFGLAKGPSTSAYLVSDASPITGNYGHDPPSNLPELIKKWNQFVSENSREGTELREYLRKKVDRLSQGEEGIRRFCYHAKPWLDKFKDKNFWKSFKDGGQGKYAGRFEEIGKGKWGYLISSPDLNMVWITLDFLQAWTVQAFYTGLAKDVDCDKYNGKGPTDPPADIQMLQYDISLPCPYKVYCWSDGKGLIFRPVFNNMVAGDTFLSPIYGPRYLPITPPINVVDGVPVIVTGSLGPGFTLDGSEFPLGKPYTPPGDSSALYWVLGSAGVIIIGIVCWYAIPIIVGKLAIGAAATGVAKVAAAGIAVGVFGVALNDEVKAKGRDLTPEEVDAITSDVLQKKGNYNKWNQEYKDLESKLDCYPSGVTGGPPGGQPSSFNPYEGEYLPPVDVACTNHWSYVPRNSDLLPPWTSAIILGSQFNSDAPRPLVGLQQEDYTIDTGGAFSNPVKSEQNPWMFFTETTSRICKNKDDLVTVDVQINFKIGDDCVLRLVLSIDCSTARVYDVTKVGDDGIVRYTDGTTAVFNPGRIYEQPKDPTDPHLPIRCSGGWLGRTVDTGKETCFSDCNSDTEQCNDQQQNCFCEDKGDHGDKNTGGTTK